MSMIKHLGLSIVIALIALCALDVGGGLPIPVATWLVSNRTGRRRTAADPCQRRRRGPAYHPPLRGRRL
jgi:hypothetical protein